MKTHNWKDVRRSKGDPERAARIQKRVERELLEMSLAELRKELGLTQMELADVTEFSQGEVSKLERRDDHLVSTLRRYVKALGGDIEITAVVGEKRIKLAV